jgi:predicted ATP-dependent endonuclease of OLD family
MRAYAPFEKKVRNIMPSKTSKPKQRAAVVSEKFPDKNPWFEDIQEFFATLTDREKVVLVLADAMSTADNDPGIKAGVYLQKLHNENLKACWKDAMRLAKQAENPKTANLAKMAGAIVALTISE